MGCREIFFAPARRKTLYFAHCGRAGAIFLSLRTQVKRLGALLGRYFFHSGSLEVAVAAVECVDEAEAPMPRASARLRHPWTVAGPGRTTIRRAKPHVSTLCPTGVEGAGGTAGPGCSARNTRGAESSPAHGHIKQPGTHTAHTAHTARGPKRRSASGPSRASVAHRLS